MVMVFDIDGVLANFCIAYALQLQKVTGAARFPHGWRTRPELLCPVWNWPEHWGYTQDEIAEANAYVSKPKADFWFNLPLMPFVKDTMTNLQKLITEGHEVYFMTDRFGHMPKWQTERWLYAHGIAYPTALIVKAKDKPVVLEALHADVFIDDKLETVQRSVGAAKRVYLYDAPYNQEETKTTTYRRVRHAKELLQREGVWRDNPYRKMMFWKD